MMRKNYWLLAALAMVMLVGAARRAEAQSRPATPVTRAAGQSAVEPVVKDPNRHTQFMEVVKKGDIDLVFLGDSITDGWRANDGKAIWDKYFAPLKAANFGIGGDRTQHILWRLRNGEADGYQPKVVVLMIGTNNTGLERDGKTPRNTTPEVIEGVTAVVRELRTKFPESRILFLAIFPRGEKAAPQRDQVAGSMTASTFSFSISGRSSWTPRATSPVR